MALIDEAKTWLRVSTDDEAITAQIQLLIDAAISDLTNTADVASFDEEGIDPLLKQAILVYVQASWVDNADEQAKYMSIYDSIKAKLATINSLYNPVYTDELKVNTALVQNPAWITDETIVKN